MSRRGVPSRYADGIDAVAVIAKPLGVHLAIFVDDQGQELVVASTHPIRVIC